MIKFCNGFLCTEKGCLECDPILNNLLGEGRFGRNLVGQNQKWLTAINGNNFLVPWFLLELLFNLNIKLLLNFHVFKNIKKNYWFYKGYNKDCREVIIWSLTERHLVVIFF